MEKVIIINAGSSSLKFQLFERETQEVVASGLVERIGIEGSFVKIKTKKGSKIKEINVENHKIGINIVLELLIEEEVIKSYDEIVKAGHRVVQGGEKYTEAVLVDDEVLKDIKDYSFLAPLHNPHNAQGIEVMKDLLPNIKNIAVFDTEFHSTMPEISYLYPTPYSWYEDYKVRRYGAHGTSHKYVTFEAARLRKKDVKEEKYIICHLGNGASLTAVEGGKSVQTSMGLTPLDGIMMGTRSGQIDPAIIEFMCKNTGKSVAEITYDLNFESGLKGVSGISSDMRDIREAVAKGDEKAKIALDIYITKIQEFVGSYIVRLGGVDAIIFTAGIGENVPYIRERVLKKLDFLGVEVDEKANEEGSMFITTKDSKITGMVIPTNEEYQIFMECEKF